MISSAHAFLAAFSHVNKFALVSSGVGPLLPARTDGASAFTRFGLAGPGLVCSGALWLDLAWCGKVRMKVAEKNRVVGAIGGEVPGNGAQETIESEIPYIVEVVVKGTADLLFHRWDCESVAEKSAAKKGSKAKREDNLESYVYRNSDGFLCLPGEYLRMSMIGAAKYRQDPRSPRKSMMDLAKAAIISLTPMASLKVKSWDYEDRRRVCIQRNAITRVRPAMKAGWCATIQLQCNLPEYIAPSLLNEVIQQAGKLIGVGDFRPTYGRFQVVGFKTIDLD